MTFPASLPIPDPVLAIARRLEEAGHEVWCVGGAVRDNLLAIPNNDFDLATSATPDVVQKLFKRTVPVGVAHGTVAVFDPAGDLHEVTTFRRDVTTDGRHAVVAFGASLEDDLARRDFTINAIAYHPLKHEWRDPFDGKADLDARVVRAVGEPRARIREDFLRIVRALRFAARFGFTIDEATWHAAKAEVDGLQHLSAERMRDEWFKGLETALKPSHLVQLWTDIGAIERWLPEVQSATGDVKRGALVLDRFAERDAVLMTSLLSTDPAATLTRLRCSNAEIERGRRIGAHRDAWPAVVTDLSVRQWMAEVGAAADDLLAMAVAEGWGGELAEVAARVRASKAPLHISDLAITGKDIMDLGVPQGPDVGILLEALLDWAIQHPESNTREDLLRQATSLTAELPIPDDVKRRITGHMQKLDDV
jgi:tRNA nucleotidyltransferase (CCA-adding enzyme)